MQGEKEMKYDFTKCTLCPRRCGADRTRSVGICGSGDTVRVAKTMLHKWEEPVISGTDGDRGSGAIFFDGCPLHCVFCQNKAISCGGVGEPVSPERLGEMMLELQSAGAYNINLVSPTQYTPLICEAIDLCRDSLTVPVVWNTGGYETVETIRMLRGYVDIYLTDFKYGSADTAARYASAPDYPDAARDALTEMVSQAGAPVIGWDGMMKRGVILRHLVLPGERRDSEAVLRTVAHAVGSENVLLALMRQYTPDFYEGDRGNLKRRLTSFEYGYVRDIAETLGFDGFIQDAESAKASYTPDFP